VRTGATRADPPSRPRRWPWLLLALAVLVAVAMLLLRWLLQPERLGAMLVERAARTTGLDIVVAQPARLGVWPGLQLELVGLEARVPGRPALLAAGRVDIALPLALLWGGELEIGALALRSPRLDLIEWRHWRDAAVIVGPPAPPSLPDLAAALSISDGMLLGDGWQMANIDIDASALRDSQPFSAAGRATLLLTGLALPARFQVAATPVETGQAIELRALVLRFGDAATNDALALDGEAVVDSRLLQLRLVAVLQEAWPPAWPALPAWAQSHVAGRRVAIDYAGSVDFDGRLQVRDEEPSTFAIAGNPRQLSAWTTADNASPLPPVTASVQLDSVAFDGVVIEGLEIDLREAPVASDD
jgi:hypothetical protein